MGSPRAEAEYGADKPGQLQVPEPDSKHAGRNQEIKAERNREHRTSYQLRGNTRELNISIRYTIWRGRGAG